MEALRGFVLGVMFLLVVSVSVFAIPTVIIKTTTVNLSNVTVLVNVPNLPASNVSQGTFGSNTGGGDYRFPRNLTVDGFLNVSGVGGNSSFRGDVQINGTLYGGSPVKISGGVDIRGGATVNGTSFFDGIIVDFCVGCGNGTVVNASQVGAGNFQNATYVFPNNLTVGNITVRDNLSLLALPYQCTGSRTLDIIDGIVQCGNDNQGNNGTVTFIRPGIGIVVQPNPITIEGNVTIDEVYFNNTFARQNGTVYFEYVNVSTTVNSSFILGNLSGATFPASTCSPGFVANGITIFGQVTCVSASTFNVTVNVTAGAGPWLYNSSTTIFYNDTYANETNDRRYINAGENFSIIVSMNNVTDLISSLTTINGTIQAVNNSKVTNLPASNITSGTFGSNFGNGNYTFPENLNVTQNLTAKNITAQDLLSLVSKVSNNTLALGFTSGGLFFMNQSGLGGFMYYMPNANNPQISAGNATGTGQFFIDMRGGRPICLNCLQVGQVETGGRILVDMEANVTNNLTVGSANNGKIYTISNAPAVTACGTGAAVDAASTSVAGRVTVGSTLLQTTCTLTFDRPWMPNAPSCVVNDATNILLVRATATTTTLTITTAVGFTGDTINWICLGYL